MSKNRTSLMAAQLVYDVLQDRMNRKTELSLEDLLSYQEILTAAQVPVRPELLRLLRQVVTSQRLLTRVDMWTVEHCLQAGLACATVPSVSEAKAALELLRMFWEEKAVTGDIISAEEACYVEYLLGNVEMKPDEACDDVCPYEVKADEQVCPDVLSTAKAKPRRLPPKPVSKSAAIAKPGKANGFAMLKDFFSSLFSRKRQVRRSARLSKQSSFPFTAQEYISHLFTRDSTRK